jgi:hypothetical protein
MCPWCSVIRYVSEVIGCGFMQTTRRKQALVSHNIRIWKQVCSSIKSRNTELYKNITSLFSFGWIVSHWILMSLSEYWTLTWKINCSVHWTLSVWKRSMFRVSSCFCSFVMVTLNLSYIHSKFRSVAIFLTTDLQIISMFKYWVHYKTETK